MSQQLPPWLENAIREEIRNAFWSDPPQHRPEDYPHDLGAERSVLAAMLEGDTFPAGQLKQDDFFAPLHARLFILLLGRDARDIEATITDILAALKNESWGADRLCSADEIFRYEPVSVGRPLRESVGRVKRLASRRRAINATRTALAFLVNEDELSRARAELRIALAELEQV